MRKLILACALLGASGASAAIPTAERDALLALFQATNGNTWTNKTGWNGQPGTECAWFGVHCDFEEKNVTALELTNNNLDGSLPAAIGSLTKLQALFGDSNELHGSLPAEIGQLSEVETIYLIRNQFTGTVPAQWSALKKLQYLGLDENQLGGTIPLVLTDMTALKELGLSNNHFEGNIPGELSRLTDLEVLSLSVNQLTGAIPAALGTLSKLQRFYAGDNELTGEIPSALGNIASLIELQLGTNKLTGAIPSTLMKLRALDTLGIANNKLSGSLPIATGDLPSIKSIDLAQNQLDGMLPAALFQLTTLEHLNLGDNRFSGSLSSDVGNLTHLQYLGLYSNQLNGFLPARLGSLSELQALDLATNSFSGTIPPQLGGLSKLEYLSLAENSFSGDIPKELGGLNALATLSVSFNELEGTIPPELGNISALKILNLGANHLRGSIPDGLRRLAALEQFTASENELTGTLPSWIGEWTHLTDLFVSANHLSGTLPAGLASLTNLAYLDLGFNEFNGPIVDFSQLTNLVYITVPNAGFSGPLPHSIGALTKLTFAEFDNNAFSGTLPAEIGNLENLEFISLQENDFEGPIPPEVGRLKKAYNLSFGGNRFSGPLPKELGELTALRFLSVGFNALKGPIPFEITRMTGLDDHASDFSFNGLYTTDERVRAFVTLKQGGDGDWEATQTVMPTNVRLVETTDRSATLSWDPIRYNYYGGGYQVMASTSPNGAPVAVATTSSKSLDSITVRNLSPSTTYFFTVATVSHPISGQENLIVSDAAAAVQGTTKPRVIAPADVVVTDAPGGLVEVDGTEVVSDSFTVTNFGDVPTSIALERNEDFFTLAPSQFSLSGGASQVVTLHAVPKPAGTYYGYVAINGVGAAEDLYVDVVLLSSARPAGTVVATPLATRIELAGAPGSDEVGVARFRNTGSARLTGIVVSDQPWVVVPPEPITIDPGSVGEVDFRIVRSRRPATTEGGLVANLTLVYVTGGESLTRGDIETLDGSNVSISKVTIVDVTKPPVAGGTIPALLPGELAYFIPGLATTTTSHGDVSIINAAGASAISDLKLYFTSGTQTSVASMLPLGFGKAVSLPNIVGSIYGGASAPGSVQIRSKESASLASEAKYTEVTSTGTLSGEIPVFRGDRSIARNAQLHLAGLTPAAEIFVQETSGGPTVVRVQFRDASGNAGPNTEYPVAGYGLLRISNSSSPGIVTATITNMDSGLITAYARNRDASGDSWSVVDWGRFYRYERKDAVRVPFADGAQPSQPGSRRRSVRTNAVSTHAATDLILYNPGASEAKATIAVTGAGERTVTVAAGTTMTVANAGGTSNAPVANIVVTPTRGDLVVTARSHHATGGSAIPVLPATAGLRLGQSQVFSTLDDSSAVRTSYGLTESSGKSVKVRVSIIIDETSPLTATITSKTFSLAPGQQIFEPELVRSFAGAQRDTLFGDLHNLTLQFEVVEGSGSVVPFLVVTDVASGDTNVMVQ